MSSSKVQKSHRDMYKARIPPWKEAYRQRCLDRLRESREKLKSRFRKIGEESDKDTFIEDLMRAEWKRLQEDQLKQHGDMDIEDESSYGHLDIDQVLEMFEDFQKELRQEEQRILQEYEIYERSLQQEERSLCSAIDKLSTEEVVCPLCKKSSLLTNKSVIFCKCGLRIDTEQDCLTLTNVKQLLDTGVSQHGEQCDTEPSFSLLAPVGPGNLVMTCQSCDWMSVVI